MDILTYFRLAEYNPSHSGPRSAPDGAGPSDKGVLGFSARSRMIVAGVAYEVRT